MTLPSGRHTSAVVAAFLSASTFYITPFDNCFMDPQLPYTTAVLVTAFLTKPPSEQAPLVLTSAWKPARPGQSRRKGIHLRRKALLDIHPKPGCAGCATSRTQFTQGSTLQIALPVNPHAGGNASHWLSHCGVTSFRHAHVPPPVNDESHPQLQASSAPICMRTWTSQDALRRCPRPPGQHELDPRSRANSFYSFHICNPHPHASSPASCALCRGAYLKHGGKLVSRLFFQTGASKCPHRRATKQRGLLPCSSAPSILMYRTNTRSSCSTTSPSTPSAVGAREASAVDHRYQGTVLAFIKPCRTTPHALDITCNTRNAASEWLLPTTTKNGD